MVVNSQGKPMAQPLIIEALCTITNFPLEGVVGGFGFAVVEDGPHAGEKAFIKPQVVTRLIEEHGWTESVYGSRVRLRLAPNKERRARENDTPWLVLDVAGTPASSASDPNRINRLEQEISQIRQELNQIKVSLAI